MMVHQCCRYHYLNDISVYVCWGSDLHASFFFEGVIDRIYELQHCYCYDHQHLVLLSKQGNHEDQSQSSMGRTGIKKRVVHNREKMFTLSESRKYWFNNSARRNI